VATTSETGKPEFDLNPDPRVLPMLGEINLDLWRCVAELVDNSIDGFLHATRNGAVMGAPEVRITLPTAIGNAAYVRVRDNGPGMTPDTLEFAVRAGWTGNNPIDNLGLFGMGFNIATARLGGLTTVWTTRAGESVWHGVEIDFDRLRQQRHFRTPHLTRPKSEASQHGTEVHVGRLKQEQLQSLAKTATQNRIRDQLARSYSAMLREQGIPLTFNLYVNERRLTAKRHCVWGEHRSVHLPDHGQVAAFQVVDRTLPDRLYCSRCMRWLGASELACTTPACSVVTRKRRIHGWLGVQRYLSESDYGIDFVRNGRKIETLSKDLFEWVVDGVSEREYPIDDPRAGGRLVGEIHLDHCRVHYTKTQFERSDPTWLEMFEIVRGRGPLRPEKAREEGFAANHSPLYLLYQAFRRSSPRHRKGVGWARLLRVKDNARAVEMAKHFDEGKAEYLDDSKWWELCQAEDGRHLREEPEAGGDDLPDGLVDEDEPRGDACPPTPEGDVDGLDTPPIPETPAPPAREAAPELTREYDASGVKWQVDALGCQAGDQGLNGRPWVLELAVASIRSYQFLFNRSHSTFRSATFTPRDALLYELARRTADFTSGGAAPVDFATALVQFRAKYCKDDQLDPRQVILDADEALAEFSRTVRRGGDREVGAALFAELAVEDQQSILRRMAKRGVTDPVVLTSDGGFLEFMDRSALKGFFEAHPELFLDGRFWDDPYSTIDFGDGASTDLARHRIVERRANLIADAAWIAELDPSDLERMGREELLRSVISIRLLQPDREE
jgi:hypothetical protein